MCQRRASDVLCQGTSGRVRYELPRNARLIGEIMGDLGYVRDRRGLRGLVGTSLYELIALVPGRFYSAGLVGPKGYGLVITAAGMARAEELYETYDPHLNHRQFSDAWMATAHQMRAANARRAELDSRR